METENANGIRGLPSGNEDQRKYRLKNRKKIQAYNKLYRQSHKEQISAKNKIHYQQNKTNPDFVQRQRLTTTKWRKNHKKQKAAYDKQWRIDHKEYITNYANEHFGPEYRKQYYQNITKPRLLADPQLRARIAKREKMWRQNNPAKVTAYQAKRRENINSKV